MLPRKKHPAVAAVWYFPPPSLVAILRHRRALVMGISVCGLAVVFRFLFMALRGGPSGPDPGDWLALGHDLFGERVRAARSVFPPVVPALAKGFTLIIPPLPALALVGATASVAAGPPLFLMAHQAGGVLWGMIATLGILFLPYSVGEALGWGGYPQMLGQGLALLSLALLCKGVVDAQMRHLALSAVAGVLAMATSVWAAAFLALAIPLLLATAFFHRLVRLNTLKQFGIWWSLPVLVGGASLAPVYWAYFANFASVPLNPAQLTPQDAFAFVFREWPRPLGSIFFVVPLASGLPTLCLWPTGKPLPLRLATPPVLLAALALYFLTKESRFLSLLEIGVWTGVLAVLMEVWAWTKEGRLPLHWERALRLMVLALAVILTAFVVVRGHQRTIAAYEWYQVVTPDVHQALDWLRTQGTHGGVVVASGNPRDFQYFWWVEGYARLPSYSATDPRWMALKDEVEQNAIARRLLASTAPAEVASLAQAHRINYLFLDKRVVKDLTPFVEGGFTPAFENATIVVLEWRLSTAPGPAPPPVPPGA